MYKEVTVAQANLHNPESAPKEIDNVLKACWNTSRPVYIELPTDMVAQDVDAQPLEQRLDLAVPQNDEEREKAVAEDILGRLYASKQPILLVDACVARHRLTNEMLDLVKKSGLPTFTSPMGKGTVDESLSNYAGVYAGIGSHKDIRAFVESSDMVLSLGTIKTDLNTTGFTYRLSELNAVDMHTDFVTIEGKKSELHMSGLLQRITSLLDASKLSKTNFTGNPLAAQDDPAYQAGTITHSYLWPSLSSWLEPGDIILTETGTASIGIWDTTFPADSVAISQVLWGSIGYTYPSAQGAALAARELKRSGRVILFEGDGSSQLTTQCIGTMLRLNLDLVIILINNSGYTIERYVHGMKETYNDIPDWKYTMLPEAMGGHIGKNAHVYTIKNKEELEKFWDSEVIKNKPKGMHFVEMFMDKEDAPLNLKMIGESSAKASNA